MRKLISIICALYAGLASAQTTYYADASRADNSGNGTSWATAKQEIQAAIDLTTAGDTVLVTNGVYATDGKAISGTFTNRVVIGSAITVKSVNGPDYTSISGFSPNGAPGATAIRAACVTNGGCLAGFTISNSFTRTSGTPSTLYRNGGGVYMESGSILSNCVVIGCRANTGGGGIYSADDTTLIIDCTIRSNSLSLASGYGGGVAGSMVITNCTIEFNRTGTGAGEGGGIYQSKAYNCNINSNLVGSVGGSAGTGGGASFNVELYNCRVIGNYAGHSGGGVDAPWIIQDTLIMNNVANAGNGGGVQDSGGEYYVYRSTITSNTAINGAGGGVCGIGGPAGQQFFYCTISSNYSAGEGGGVYGVSLLTNCDVFANIANNAGGGVASSAEVLGSRIYGNFTSGGNGGGVSALSIVSNCVIYGNSTDVNGGGADACSTIVDSVISNNVAVGLGGGISTASLVSNCVVSANQADTGGGTHNCTLITDSIISNNVVLTFGGGVYDDAGVWNTIRKSYIIGNSGGYYAGGLGTGAGLCLAEGCIVFGNIAENAGGGADWDMYNCTIASNVATTAYGGVVISSGNGEVVENCIIDGNYAPTSPDMGFDPNELFYNNLCSTWDITGDTRNNIKAPANFVNIATRDLRVQAGSQAIGNALDLSGTHPLLSPDILGTVRTVPWTIGALQYVSSGPTWAFNKALWNMQVAMMFMKLGANKTPIPPVSVTVLASSAKNEYVENGTNFTAYSFYGAGWLTISNGNIDVEVLLVGQGGSAIGQNGNGGGGGGGGDVQIVKQTLYKGQTYQATPAMGVGESSIFNGVAAVAGGRGGTNGGDDPTSGGSGGGGQPGTGAAAGTGMYKNAGGDGTVDPDAGTMLGGGGGGAGGAGGAAGGGVDGNGGDGYPCSFTGTLIYYGYGGMGNDDLGTSSGTPGLGGHGYDAWPTEHRGGGQNAGNPWSNADGGSGIIIIRFRTPGK